MFPLLCQKKNPMRSIRNEILIVVWKPFLVVSTLFIVILNNVLPVTKSNRKSDSSQVTLRFPLNIRLDDFCIKLCPLWQETRDASVYIYIYIDMIYIYVYIYMCLPLLPQKSETICPVFPPLKSVHPRRWGSCNQLPNLTISWIHIAAIPICAAVPNGSRFCWTSLGGIHFSSASMGFLWACPSWMARKQHQGPCCFWKAHHHEGETDQFA